MKNRTGSKSREMAEEYDFSQGIRGKFTRAIPPAPVAPQSCRSFPIADWKTIGRLNGPFGRVALTSGAPSAPRPPTASTPL